MELLKSLLLGIRQLSNYFSCRHRKNSFGFYPVLDWSRHKLILAVRLFKRKFDTKIPAVTARLPALAFTVIAVTFFCWYVPNDARAAELFEDFNVHGFFTQEYFLTSDNNIFGTSSDGGSFDFTEVGLNASWSPIVDLRLAGQILFRRAGAGHEHDLELDFGLVDYTILSTADYRLGTRLGRYKNPYGFYNATRDVLFTKPSILLPQSIYFERTRELALSADGGLLYGEYRGEWGDLSLEFGIGIPRGDNLDTELVLVGANYPGETHSELSYIGQLAYELEGGKYRIAISSAWVDTRYDPKFLPPEVKILDRSDLPSLKLLFKPMIFSAQYNQDKLSITSEYAIRRFEQIALDTQSSRSITGESYYLQALYRFDENLEAVLRYDALYNNREDRHGNKYQALTGKPNYTQFAKDWTFGLRYYVNSSFLVAAEYHHVNGTAWLPIQDNPDPDRLERGWHMFSLAASYRF